MLSWEILIVSLTSFLTSATLTGPPLRKMDFDPVLGHFEVQLEWLMDRLCDQCHVELNVCLTHYQVNLDLHSHQGTCTFGKGVLRSSLPKQTMTWPIDFKWPGAFTLIIEEIQVQNGSTASSHSNILVSRKAFSQFLDSGVKWTRGVKSDTSSGSVDFKFRLVCSQHYFGTDCNTFCRPRDDPFGHFGCSPSGEKICLRGYQRKFEGDYCTQAICIPVCHAEQGLCTSPGQCSCENGWTGPRCETCLRYPGCHHGTCQSPWECDCKEGWGGLLCDQDLNFCTNHKPCRNGATCLNTGQGSYTCLCPDGYAGINCEKGCGCENGGTCLVSGLDNLSCVCPPGFHGSRCEIPLLTCEVPCICVDLKCDCPSGFKGTFCSECLSCSGLEQSGKKSDIEDKSPTFLAALFVILFAFILLAAAILLKVILRRPQVQFNIKIAFL